MNVAAAPVIGAALFALCIGLLYLSLSHVRGSTDPKERLEENVGTPRKASIQMVIRFGGVILILALGTAVGVLAWDLSLEAVGIYGNPVRELAIGLAVAPVFAGFSYLLKYVIFAVEEKLKEPQPNEQNEAEPSMDFLEPGTPSELGWLLGGISIQASAEEVYFRAAFVGALAALLSVSAWYLVVPSALLFGLMHSTGGMGKVLHASLLGVALGAVFVVGGILAAVVVHVLHNQFSTIKNYVIEDYGKDSLPTPPSSDDTQKS
jgi:membrane protease YdiL (CAAX protease family)